MMSLGLFATQFIKTVAPTAPSAATPSSPTPPELSEEELKQLEQQMETEISSFVQSLPPEQQEQFYKDVEALTDAMSQMSEEELTQFIEGVFTEPTAPTTPPQPEKPAVAPAKSMEKIEEKPKKEEEKPTLPKKQVEKAVELLDAISNHINSLLHKTQLIIGLPEKVQKWGTAGFIKGWRPQLTWQKIQEDMVRLAQKLRSLMSRDPKTKEYRFIADFIQDKVLYNNLAQFKRQLAAYEPKIEIPELDIMKPDLSVKLNLSSKEAIRSAIGSILEAKELLKVPEAIDTIIAKYGPLAEKIKQEEEEAVKKALEELMRPRRPETVKVIGVPEEPDYGYPTYPSYEPGYGYAPPYYAPARPGEPPAKPTEAKKPTAPKKDEKEKRPTGAPSAAPTTQPATPEEKRLDNLLGSIATDLGAAFASVDSISGYPNWKNYLKIEGIPDDVLLDDFNDLRASIRSAASNIEGFNASLKSLAENKRSNYANRIKEILKTHKESLTKLKEKLKEWNEQAHEEKKAKLNFSRVQAAITRLDKAIEKILK